MRMHIAWYVSRPDGASKHVDEQLSFIERWKAERLFSSTVIDRMMCLWVWCKAAALLDGRGPHSCLLAIKRSKKLLRKRFPKLSQSAVIEVRGGVGAPGTLVCIRELPWAADIKRVAIGNLPKAAASLDDIKHLHKSGSFECSRASSRGVRAYQRHKGKSGIIYSCSASRGAGIVGHGPFLDALKIKRPGIVQFPSRSRLGRSGWRGAMQVLEAAGVRVQFGEASEGADAPGRSNKGEARVAGLNLAGCVVVPAWLGVGQAVGNVAVVGGGAARSVRVAASFAPGDDVRVEHLLLQWSLAGLGYPVRLLGPVSGKVLSFRR